jgi:hypothetical protein
VGNLTLQLEEGNGPTEVRPVLGVQSLGRYQRRLEQLGLLTPGADQGDVLKPEPGLTRGLSLGFTEADRDPELQRPVPGDITGLDHIVFNTHNPDGAAALWGARIGLDMRLDLQRGDWGVRLLFFRAGDAIIEIAQSLKASGDADRDSFYGLSWRTNDIDACRERLTSSGFDVSGIRTGRKPGTRVCTLRNAPGAIPTLVIEPAPAKP